MTSVIGIILMLTFLGFAVFMFLERLSALLALPLMAIAFLVVAVGADLFQPAQVREVVSRDSSDSFGRQRVEVVTQMVPSRFEQWKQVRQCQAELLHAKADLMNTAVGQLLEALDRGDESAPQHLREALTEIRTQEQEFQRRASTQLAAWPDFFARPPHNAGLRTRFDESLSAIDVSGRLKPIATVLDQYAPREAIPRVREILTGAHTEGQRWLGQYAAPADSDSTRFTLFSTLAYLVEYLMFVLRAGSLHLYATIIATVFGGMFAMYVKNLNVAERLVYWTAEFAGQRPLFICLAVFFVTAGIFTSVGGLGTVIMLGTIILPILRSVGVGPIVGAGVFLIAIAMGGTLQPVSRRLWMDFYGIPAAQLDTLLWSMVGLYLVCGLGWMWWGTRRRLLSSFDSVATEEVRPPQLNVPMRLMLAPLIPVALVYFGRVEELSAFTVSIVYMYLCVCRRRGAARVLARSLIEGAQAVMPPVLLMVGIGILVTALSTPPVQSYLRPLLVAAVPSSRWGYMALFALAAPLALYRGPLNVWGMGLAVSATLLATSALPPAAILGAILAAGMLQGVCDPTNTQNVWIAGYQGVSVNQILRYTLLPVWLAAAIAIVVFGLWYVN